MLLVTIGAAAATESSVSHDVNIAIASVRMLEVQQNWETRSSTRDSGGNTVIHLVSRYGVTCNVPDSSIEAVLVSPLPGGVTVRLRMTTTVGTGTGWHNLATNGGTQLVQNPRGAEFNTVEVVVSVPADVDPGSVQLDLSFGIR